MDRGTDPFAGLKMASDDYKVYDSHYEKIGKVDDLIVDDEERVLYLGVKMGFLGTGSTLVPVEIARVNDRRHLVEVQEPADTIKHAPHFGRSEELTAEMENHVRNYYGLDTLQPSPEHGGDLPGGLDVSGDLERRMGDDDRVDTVPGERASQQNFTPTPTPEEGPAEREPAQEREPTGERTAGERTAGERTAGERTAGERTAGEREPARGRTAEERAGSPAGESREEPISERLSEEPEHRSFRPTTDSGVTVHRLRR